MSSSCSSFPPPPPPPPPSFLAFCSIRSRDGCGGNRSEIDAVALGFATQLARSTHTLEAFCCCFKCFSAFLDGSFFFLSFFPILPCLLAPCALYCCVVVCCGNVFSSDKRSIQVSRRLYGYTRRLRSRKQACVHAHKPPGLHTHKQAAAWPGMVTSWLLMCGLPETTPQISSHAQQGPPVDQARGVRLEAQDEAQEGLPGQGGEQQDPHFHHRATPRSGRRGRHMEVLDLPCGVPRLMRPSVSTSPPN